MLKLRHFNLISQKSKKMTEAKEVRACHFVANLKKNAANCGKFGKKKEVKYSNHSSMTAVLYNNCYHKPSRMHCYQL